jgi:hypothetical protein
MVVDTILSLNISGPSLLRISCQARVHQEQTVQLRALVGKEQQQERFLAVFGTISAHITRQIEKGCLMQRFD